MVTMLISVTRYYMSLKAEHVQFADDKKLTIIHLSCIIFHYIFNFGLLLLVAFFPWISSALYTKCVQPHLDIDDQPPRLMFIGLVYNFSVCFLGVVCDIRTFILILRQKKKVSVTGAELIPWNAGYAKSYDSAKVPIHATFIAGLVIGVQAVIIPFTAYFFHTKAAIWNNVIAGSVGNCIYVPIIIAFIAKNKEKKKPAIKPPIGLQGLDDPNDHLGQITIDVKSLNVHYRP